MCNQIRCGTRQRSDDNSFACCDCWIRDDLVVRGGVKDVSVWTTMT